MYIFNLIKDMVKVVLSDYILRLRRNLLALSFFVIFYNYSDAKLSGSVFILDIMSININFLHKSIFYYLLYQLVYFSLYVIHYLATVRIEFLKNKVREADDDMYKTDYDRANEENSDDMYRNDFPGCFLVRYDKILRYIESFKVIVIFSLIECIFPIVASVFSLILLW